MGNVVKVKNISNFEQLGLDPGKSGEVDIPQDQLDRLIERGALEKTDKVESPTPPETPPPAGGPTKPGGAGGKE